MIDWMDEAAAELMGVVEQLPQAPSPQQMRDLGLMDLCLPEAAGGIGMGAEALARVLEALAQHDAGSAAWLYGHGAAQLAWYGRGVPDGDDDGEAPLPGQRWAWPGFHDVGRHDWPCVDRKGLVSGRLSACLLGQTADAVVTPVRMPDGQLALFRFQVAQPGVVRQAGARFMGLQAAGMADLQLTQVGGQLQCDQLEARLQGLASQLAACVMAMLCGLMHGSLQTAQTYATERHQGGGNLLGWGEVRRLLAVQHERLSMAQAALSSALRALVRPAGDQDAASRVQALLLQCGEAATALATDGVQLLGGNGYMKDYGQAQRLCDAWQLQGLMGPAAQRRQDLLALCLQA